jgi:hypothetical protein
MAAIADSNQTKTKLDALQEAARARNIELSIYRIASREEISAVLDTAKNSGHLMFWRLRCSSDSVN